MGILKSIFKFLGEVIDSKTFQDWFKGGRDEVAQFLPAFNEGQRTVTNLEFLKEPNSAFELQLDDKQEMSPAELRMDLSSPNLEMENSQPELEQKLELEL